MSDAFALLDLPRRPWLEADDVRAAFQRKAAVAHPDRQGESGDFSELTRAYETLREPASRLRHLLTLEQPGLTIPTGVPPDLMDWFPRVGVQLKALKDAALKRAAATSALARAMATAGLADANRVQNDVKALREQVFVRVREIDAEWPAGDPAELATLAARLGFLDKWIAQLSEAALALRL